MRPTVLLAFLILAACGAQGAPQPPAAHPVPGISVSGTASVGVSAKL